VGSGQWELKTHNSLLITDNNNPTNFKLNTMIRCVLIDDESNSLEMMELAFDYLLSAGKDRGNVQYRQQGD
jgi:hypothetical protein